MKIYSYTIIYSSTEAFQERTPYVASILEDESGNRVSAILEGYTEGQSVHIGMPVTARTDENGHIIYSL